MRGYIGNPIIAIARLAFESAMSYSIQGDFLSPKVKTNNRIQTKAVLQGSLNSLASGVLVRLEELQEAVLDEMAILDPTVAAVNYARTLSSMASLFSSAQSILDQLPDETMVNNLHGLSTEELLILLAKFGETLP